MARKHRLRLISCVMFVVAVVFVFCALSALNLGTAFYIGRFHFGAEVWRVCYAIYGVIMAALFASSFFVKDNQRANKE